MESINETEAGSPTTKQTVEKFPQGAEKEEQPSKQHKTACRSHNVVVRPAVQRLVFISIITAAVAFLASVVCLILTLMVMTSPNNSTPSRDVDGKSYRVVQESYQRPFGLPLSTFLEVYFETERFLRHFLACWLQCPRYCLPLYRVEGDEACSYARSRSNDINLSVLCSNNPAPYKRLKFPKSFALKPKVLYPAYGWEICQKKSLYTFVSNS